MKYLRFKLKVWYGIRVNFSFKKVLKPKFLLSCFVKLAPGVQQQSTFKAGSPQKHNIHVDLENLQFAAIFISLNVSL